MSTIARKQVSPIDLDVHAKWVRKAIYRFKDRLVLCSVADDRTDSNRVILATDTHRLHGYNIGPITGPERQKKVIDFDTQGPLDGTWPTWQRIVPYECANAVCFDARVFLAAIKPFAQHANRSVLGDTSTAINTLRLTQLSGLHRLSIISEHTGITIAESINVEPVCGSIDIGLNYFYIKEALQGFKGDVMLGWNKAERPIVITSREAAGNTNTPGERWAVIMPTRIS